MKTEARNIRARRTATEKIAKKIGRLGAEQFQWRVPLLSSSAGGGKVRALFLSLCLCRKELGRILLFEGLWGEMKACLTSCARLLLCLEKLDLKEEVEEKKRVTRKKTTTPTTPTPTPTPTPTTTKLPSLHFCFFFPSSLPLWLCTASGNPSALLLSPPAAPTEEMALLSCSRAVARAGPSRPGAAKPVNDLNAKRPLPRLLGPSRPRPSAAPASSPSSDGE